LDEFAAQRLQTQNALTRQRRRMDRNKPMMRIVLALCSTERDGESHSTT
jgi:hypothetical protein